MSAEELSVKDVLIAYSQGRVKGEAVVRSLIRHRGWLVPAIWLVTWRSHTSKIVTYGDVTKLPPGELWIFSDQAAALLAAEAGAQLGHYAADISGSDIFRRLDGKWDVKINPGSPRVETWFQSRQGSAMSSMWCEAVELEDALAQVPESDIRPLIKLIYAYRWFVVLMRKSDHGLVTYMDQAHNQVAPLFTTEDNLEPFLEKFSPAERGQIHPASVVGADVIEAVRRNEQISRVVINAFGPAASRVIYLR